MTGVQAEIHALLMTPAIEVHEPLGYSGRGMSCTLTPEPCDPSFVQTPAFEEAAENLSTKLLLRKNGGFHSDEGIRHDSISWLALKGVEVIDSRLGEIASYLGGAASRYVTLTAWNQAQHDRSSYSPSSAHQRAYLLGAGAIMRATEIVSYSRKQASTYLSIVFHQESAPGRDVPIYYTTAIPAPPPIATALRHARMLQDIIAK